MSKPKVAVTGATGLVGSHLLSYLVERGYPVTAIVRQTSNVEQLKRIAGPGKLMLAVAELGDPSAIAAALSEGGGAADVVVHAAGAVDPYGRRPEIFAINVGGTRSVLEASIDLGVKQFIQISSLSVITGQDDQFDVTEEAQLRYCGESYADSKVDAERLVMAEAGRGRIEVTALRPGFIYGPGERAWMPRLISSLTAGKAMLIDGGNRATNVIYVENLCRAAEAALLNPRAFGRVYNLTDGQRVTKKMLFDAICDGLAVARVTRKVPQAVARLVCEVVSSFAPLLPVSTQRELSRYSRAAFRLAGVNQGFSIARAELELGYTDRIPFEQGMTRTLACFGGAASRTWALPKNDQEKVGEPR